MVAKATIDRLGKRTSSTSAGKHRRGRRALTGTRTYCGDRVAGEYEWGRLVGRGDRRACPRQDAGDDFERARDVGTLDPVVRHGAKSRAAPEVARDAQAALRARALEGARVHPLRVHLERDDVRDHLPRVDADPADAGEAIGEGARVAVVVDEAVAHLLKPDERRRGDDPGLPHRSAKELANASGLRHGLGAAAEDRADRRRQTLREAELHRVRGRRKLARIDAERDRRVEDPRAVQVDAQAPAVREFGDRGGLVGREDAAAAVVVRVLETHERRAREHARWPDRGLDVGERWAAVAVRHEPWLDRAEDEGGAHLVLIDVRAVAEDDLVAALGLRQDATQVPEHAARDVDRGLLAEDLRGPLFKPV